MHRRLDQTDLVNVEAFILVGGRSTRLGRDKAFERIGDKSLAELSLETVRDAGIASKISFVAGNEVKFAIEAERLDTPFVFDLVEGRGPLGGIYTALTNASAAKWVFVLACDLPFVTADLLNRLSAFGSDDFGAVVPEQLDGRLQPLCAFYKVREAMAVVDEIIRRPRVSPPVREVIALLNPRVVTPVEYEPAASAAKDYFLNINTETDLAEARKNRDKN